MSVSEVIHYKSNMIYIKICWKQLNNQSDAIIGLSLSIIAKF